MAGVYVSITGIDTVQAYLDKVKAGAAAAGGETVMVGTDLVYGYGIETGSHRGGRLARRAGGAFFLRDAFNMVKPRIADALTAALPKGAEATLGAMTKLGFDVQREAQVLTPVVTGSLRRSLHTVVGRR